MSSDDLAQLLPGLHPLLCGPCPLTSSQAHSSTVKVEGIITAAVGSSLELTHVYESYARWRRCFLVWRKLLGSDVLLLALLVHAGCVWMPDYVALHTERERAYAAFNTSSREQQDTDKNSSTKATTTSSTDITTVNGEVDLEREITQAWQCHVTLQRAQPASVWALHVLHYLRLLEVYEVNSTYTASSSNTKGTGTQPAVRKKKEDEAKDVDEDSEVDVITVSSSSSSALSSSSSHESSASSSQTSSSEASESQILSTDNTTTMATLQHRYGHSGELLPLYLPINDITTQQNTTTTTGRGAVSPASPVSSPTQCCVTNNSVQQVTQQEYVLRLKATVTVIDSDEPLVQRVATLLVDEWVEMLTLTETNTSTVSSTDIQPDDRPQRVHALRAYWFASALKFAAYVDASQSALLEENGHIQALLRRQAIPLTSALELCCKSIPSILHCFLVEEATAYITTSNSSSVGLCMPPMAMLIPYTLLGPMSRVSVYARHNKGSNESNSSSTTAAVSRRYASTRRNGLSGASSTATPQTKETSPQLSSEAELVPCIVVSSGFAAPCEPQGQLRLHRLDEDVEEDNETGPNRTNSSNDTQCEGFWWFSLPQSSSSSYCTHSSLTCNSPCGFLRIDQAIPRRLFMRPLPSRDSGTAAWSSTNTTTTTKTTSITTSSKDSNTANSTTASMLMSVSGMRCPTMTTARRRLRERRARLLQLKKAATMKAMQRTRLRRPTTMRMKKEPADRQRRNKRKKKAVRRNGTQRGRTTFTRRAVLRRKAKGPLDEKISETTLPYGPQADLYESDLRNETLVALSIGDVSEKDNDLRVYLETILQVQLVQDTDTTSTTTIMTNGSNALRRSRRSRRSGTSLHSVSASNTSTSSALLSSDITLARRGMSRHGLGAVLLFLFTTARRLLGMRGLLSTMLTKATSPNTRDMKTETSSNVLDTTKAATSNNNTSQASKEMEEVLLLRCAATLGLTALLLSHNLPDVLLSQPAVTLWTTEVGSFLVDLSVLPQRPLAALLRSAGYAIALVPNRAQATLVAAGLLATLGQREVDCIEGGSEIYKNNSTNSQAEGSQSATHVRMRVPWWPAFRHVVLQDATLAVAFAQPANMLLVTKMTANIERCITVALARKRQPWRSAGRHAKNRHVLVSIEEANNNNTKEGTLQAHERDNTVGRYGAHKQPRSHTLQQENDTPASSRVKLQPSTRTATTADITTSCTTLTNTGTRAQQGGAQTSTRSGGVVQDIREVRVERNRSKRPPFHLAWERNTPLNTTTTTSTTMKTVRSTTTTTVNGHAAPRLYTDISSTSKSTLTSSGSTLSTSHDSRTNDSTTSTDAMASNNKMTHASSTFITPVRTWQGNFVRGPAVVRGAEGCTVCVEDIATSSSSSNISSTNDSLSGVSTSHSSCYAYEPTGSDASRRRNDDEITKTRTQEMQQQEEGNTSAVQPSSSEGTPGRRKYVSLAQVLRTREQRMLQAAASALYLSLESTTLACRSATKSTESSTAATSPTTSSSTTTTRL